MMEQYWTFGDFESQVNERDKWLEVADFQPDWWVANMKLFFPLTLKFSSFKYLHFFTIISDNFDVTSSEYVSYLV